MLENISKTQEIHIMKEKSTHNFQELVNNLIWDCANNLYLESAIFVRKILFMNKLLWIILLHLEMDISDAVLWHYVNRDRCVIFILKMKLLPAFIYNNSAIFYFFIKLHLMHLLVYNLDIHTRFVTPIYLNRNKYKCWPK